MRCTFTSLSLSLAHLVSVPQLACHLMLSVSTLTRSTLCGGQCFSPADARGQMTSELCTFVDWSSPSVSHVKGPWNHGGRVGDLTAGRLRIHQDGWVVTTSEEEMCVTPRGYQHHHWLRSYC
ncbi:hypothetical protein BaRGS_00024440 [Batillaria attramentaria]|uniref:Secreted protein n=1 Tax=Batillaria attramentaria TaxID=370345 RepID=A0ABD0KB11_9CAEN